MKKSLLIILIGFLLLLSVSLPLKSAKAETNFDIIDMRYDAYYVYGSYSIDYYDFYQLYSDVQNDTVMYIACPYVISSLVDNVRTNTMYYYLGIHKIDLNEYVFYFGDTSNNRDYVTFTLNNNTSTYESRNLSTYICLPYSMRNNDINYALYHSGLIDFEVDGYTLTPGFVPGDVQYYYLENQFYISQLQSDYDDLYVEYNRIKTLYETSNTNFFRNVFDSIGGIFNVEVFPGFTIGTFIFIPLMFIVLIILLRLAL